MVFIVVAISIAVLLLCIVILGMALGYDRVELTFHPLVFVKLRLTRVRRR